MKKHIKLILGIVLIVLISVGLFYKYKNYTYTKKVAETKKQELKAQSKIIDKSPSLIAGDNQTLSLGLTNKNAVNKNFKWSSSNPDIATVDENGIVKAIKSGKVTITATAPNESKKTYTVNVNNNSTKSNFSVATEYNADLFATRIVITLNGVKPADLNKYIVKYAGNEVKLHSETNTFRLVVDGNVNSADARSKVSVSSK